MSLFRRVLGRLRKETLLLVLLLAFLPLFWLAPVSAHGLAALVDWKTIGALAGLMVLSRGLEESGFLASAGQKIIAGIRTERTLAMVLVLFSALLSAFITNDVALFIVVPLTLGLGAVAELPMGRLVIFEAFAVNAGSAISPIGNPQNLFLWQASGATIPEFLWAMGPLVLALMFLLLVAVTVAFSRRIITVNPLDTDPGIHRTLFIVSLLLYPVFLVLVDLGFAMGAASGVLVLYWVFSRNVLLGLDWMLLLVFLMMFVDLGLLSHLPAIAALAQYIDGIPGGVFSAGVLLSQVISNVPAAIFLESFTDEWQLLAWGVSVGGFGLGIGSLANLIAIRLSRGHARWSEFHAWSIPFLIAGSAVAYGLLHGVR
ncbi:MAG: SLC13 family permease [Balneolaceae bacterium]